MNEWIFPCLPFQRSVRFKILILIYNIVRTAAVHDLESSNRLHAQDDVRSL